MKNQAQSIFFEAPRDRTRIVDRAAKVLTDWLEASKFPVHSRLPPERALAKELNLSRGKLREALGALEASGRIWRHVGMGTFLGGRPSSIKSTPESLGAATTLNEILEARAMIEPVVARLAALRVEQHELKMICQYHAMAKKSTTWAEWEKQDELFHRAIAEASGNGVMISTIDQLLRIKTHPRWSVSKQEKFDFALVRRYSEEHATLLAAITSKNPELAEAAMRKHMRGVTLTVGPVMLRKASSA